MAPKTQKADSVRLPCGHLRKLFTRLVKAVYVQVATGTPFRPADVSQSGRNQHQRALAIGERTDYSRPATNLFHDSLQHAVAPKSRPVFTGKAHVVQRLLHAQANRLG